jgi:pyruvate dehydrogenase E1 component alpha subunit
MEAVERARSGGGPSLVECKTYRYYGHHQGDETLRYRTEAEEQAARRRDPLLVFRDRVLAAGSLDERQLDEVDARSRAAVDAAVAFAEESPVPAPEELYTHVYVD